MEVDLLKLPRVIDALHTVEPTWSKNAGRNSNNGDFGGTFVGYFDTLNVTVGETTQSELTQIRNKVEVPIIENVKFLDSRTGLYKTEDFYPNAIAVKIKSLKMAENTKKYPSFSFILTATKRRTDM